MWNEDERVGRAQMVFTGEDGKIKGQFIGKFLGDAVDGSNDGFYEDADNNRFSVVEDVGPNNAVSSGHFERGRLQGRARVDFANGDKFDGTYVDGRPCGFGQMDYFNSIPDDPYARNSIS